MNDDTRSIGGRRLHRDADRELILGVCAGVADYFGFDLGVTRILTALSLLFFTFPTLIAYFMLALLLPKQPRLLGRPRDAEEDSLRRQVRSAPQLRSIT
ncbi:MAG: PspC domain-containing protein [Candidatus Rariloculaceae bacterium]